MGRSALVVVDLLERSASMASEDAVDRLGVQVVDSLVSTLTRYIGAAAWLRAAKVGEEIGLRDWLSAGQSIN